MKFCGVFSSYFVYIYIYIPKKLWFLRPMVHFFPFFPPPCFKIYIYIFSVNVHACMRVRACVHAGWIRSAGIWPRGMATGCFERLPCGVSPRDEGAGGTRRPWETRGRIRAARLVLTCTVAYDRRPESARFEVVGRVGEQHWTHPKTNYSSEND